MPASNEPFVSHCAPVAGETPTPNIMIHDERTIAAAIVAAASLLRTEPSAKALL
jgi:hypothetical protein